MKKFTLKSGNKPMFKAMGSSPLHVHDGTTSTTTHNKDGSPKTAVPQHEVTPDYQKRKEALLDKGFTQEDADWMIKHGGDIDTKPAPEHPKYEKKKKKSPTKQNGDKAARKKEAVKDSVPAYDPTKDPQKDPYYLKAQKKYDSLHKKNPELAESFRIKKNSKNKKGEYEMYIAPKKKKKSPLETEGHGGKKGHIHKVKGEGDKDITKRGGFNEEITEGIKEGKTKVYKKPDGTIYTSTGV